MNRSLLIALLTCTAAEAAGPPGPLDTVPRQTSFAGHLEENGVPKTRTSLATTVNLYGTDGGVQWTRTVNVPVNKGRFAIELGDNPALPAAVLNSLTTEVELSVGTPAVKLPRQRVLSAPYAHRSGDTIVDDRTITVGSTGQFPGLAEAWAWLKTKAVRGSVTVQIANGNYILPAGGVTLEHPDGARIKIVGNLTTPGSVLLTSSTDGLIIDNGAILAQLAGFRLTGTGTGIVGVRVGGGSRVNLGPAVVDGFDVAALKAYDHAMVTLTGVSLSCRVTSSGVALFATDETLVTGTGTVISQAQLGISVASGAWLQLDGVTISMVRDGVNVSQRGFAELGGTVTVSSAQTGLYAAGQSTIVAPVGITFTGVTTARSPALNTVGNGNSWITE